MNDRGLTEGIGWTFSKVCSDILVKCGASLVYVIYAFSFDTLQGRGLVALLFLIIADFITGIYASYKTGHKIQSPKIFRTVIKIVIYYLMIALAHFTELAVPVLSQIIDETVLAFLAVTELVSNFENLSKLGYAIPQKLFTFLKDFKSKK